MAETAVTVQVPNVNDGTVFTPVAIDATNGNSFTWTQLTGLVIYNTDGAAATLDVTITSSAAATGFSKTITKAAIADGDALVVNFLASEFVSDGNVNIAYNGASGTSTTGVIIPIRYTRA